MANPVQVNPQQQGHIDWLKEAKALIKKQGNYGVIDKAVLRRTINYTERAIRATQATSDPSGWLDTRDLQYRLDPKQLEEAKGVYELLIGIAKWLRA